MHDTKLKLKSGKEIWGPIWCWRPKEGYLEITNNETGKCDTIRFSDIEEGTEYGQRVTIRSPPEGEDVDVLARAKEDGWDGT